MVAGALQHVLCALSLALKSAAKCTAFVNTRNTANTDI